MPDQSQPVGQLTIKISAMPADTNANGDIFGGWVMARMDQAGGIAGVERAQGRVVTVKVDTAVDRMYERDVHAYGRQPWPGRDTTALPESFCNIATILTIE